MNSSEAPFMNERLAGAEEVARHRNRKPHRARRSVLFQGPPSLMRGIRRSSGSRCSIPSKNSPEAPSLDETLLYPEERRAWEASDPLDDLGSLETLASDGWRIGWEMAQEMEMGFNPPSLFLLLLRSLEDHYDLRRFGVDTDRKANGGSSGGGVFLSIGEWRSVFLSWYRSLFLPPLPLPPLPVHRSLPALSTSQSPSSSLFPLSLQLPLP
ncbi:hypothetical protein BHM03_00033725 [Ensete ventricosum]|nr:hypothetical protein BHM03_00033725 [Ensete ventricosum]